MIARAAQDASATVTTATVTTPTERRWFEGLDGIRFIAAFLVIVHHAGFSSGATFRWDLGGLMFTRMDIGVAIFFVLSGFLLYRPFVVSQFTASPPPATMPFWIRRVVRIFPAYWVAFLFLLAIGTVTVDGIEGFVLSFTLTHVYAPDYAVSGLTQSWTLATELGFYLALPFLAALGRRVSERTAAGVRSLNHQALRLLVVCAVLALSSFVFRAVMFRLSPYELDSWGTVSRLWTPSHLDVFAAGMALAVVSVWAEHRRLVRDATTSATRRVWVWWLVAAGTFWFLSAQLDLARGLDLASFEREMIRQTLYVVVGVALVAPVVFARPGSTPGLRFLAWRPMAWLGIVSYGIYLWHQAVLSWTHDLFGWPDLTGNFVVLLTFATVGSAAIAGLSHRFGEDPASVYVRDRLRSTTRPARRSEGDG